MEKRLRSVGTLLKLFYWKILNTFPEKKKVIECVETPFFPPFLFISKTSSIKTLIILYQRSENAKRDSRDFEIFESPISSTRRSVSTRRPRTAAAAAAAAVCRSRRVRRAPVSFWDRPTRPLGRATYCNPNWRSR